MILFVLVREGVKGMLVEDWMEKDFDVISPDEKIGKVKELLKVRR